MSAPDVSGPRTRGSDNELTSGADEPRAVLAEIARNCSPNKAYSPIVLAGLVRLSEFLMLAGAGFAVQEFHVAPRWGHAAVYIIGIPSMALLAVVALQALGLYHVSALRTPLRQGLKLASGWAFVFVAELAAVFFLKLDPNFSRIWLAGWFFAGLGLLFVERFSVAALVRILTQQGKLDRRTAIVGGGPAAAPVLHALASQDDGDLRILGVFDDRSDTRSPDVVAGYPKLGTVDDLVEFARHTRLDLVIFTLPISAEDRLLQMLRKLWILPVDIRLAAHTNKLRFRQPRYGFNNEKIEIYKFRSMYADRLDSAASRLVTRDDPRVTRVGRFIRKTSLDELPQLFNVVFKGDLSLVGPRPHAMQARAADHLYDEVVDGYFARHRVKPGMTGWAQINGWRGETDTPEKIQSRVEHDLDYIENWSLLRDIYILAMTPFALLRSENAY